MLALICRSISSVLLCTAVVFTADSAWGEISPWFVKSIHNETLGSGGFKSITGMATDPVSGEIYVLDAGRHAIDVIDSAGFPRYTFTHWITDQKNGLKSAGEPNSIVISPSGDIFLTDLFSRSIDLLNIRGEVMDHIDMLADVGWQDASLRPEKLGLDTNGWLYASIGGNRSGVLRRRVEGGRAEVFIDAAKEKIDCITGLGVAPDGRVAVLDYRGTPAVRVYDTTGKQIVAFAGHEVEPGDLSLPAAMLFADDGTFWVADQLRQAIMHYSDEGKYLEYIGGFGSSPGNVMYPSALAGDGVAHIAVAERVGGRVQEYVLPGALAAAQSKSKKPQTVSAAAKGTEQPTTPAVASELQTEQ